MTGGTSHSSIRPISDIGRLLIRGDPFRGRGRGRGDESPRYHSFPPAGQFAPPMPPQNRKATRGSSTDGPSIFSPYSGDSQEFALPAPGTSLLTSRPFRPGAGGSSQPPRRTGSTEPLVLTSFRLLLRVAVNRECWFVAPAYQPALPPGGGRVVANAITTRIGRRAAITHLACLWVSTVCFVTLHRRRDVKAVAVPFAIRWGIKAVGVCPTRECVPCEMRCVEGPNIGEMTTIRYVFGDGM